MASKKSKKKAKPAKRATAPKKKHTVIHRAAPAVGSKFERTFKGKKYVMTVVAGDGDGQPRYQVGKQTYPSPSAAGTAVTGKPSNGWTFWHMDSDGEETK